MRNPLSDTIVNIPPSGIRKFFDVVSEMKGAISLGVGEPDFDTPWHIREEGIYSLEKGRTFYTSNSGLKELRQEICHYLKRRQRLEYDPNTEVMVTVGGSEAIDIALRAMLNPGDEVLIPQPSYVSYVPCTVLAGGTPVIIELEEKDEFRLTPEKLLERILGNMGLEITDTMPAEFYCNCSRERVKKAVISLGKNDLQEMIDEGQPVTVKCDFCNTDYVFDTEELKEIIKE